MDLDLDLDLLLRLRDLDLEVFFPLRLRDLCVKQCAHLRICVTRSYAALRAADLDWIVGPGYSLGRVQILCFIQS